MKINERKELLFVFGQFPLVFLAPFWCFEDFSTLILFVKLTNEQVKTKTHSTNRFQGIFYQSQWSRDSAISVGLPSPHRETLVLLNKKNINQEQQ